LLVFLKSTLTVLLLKTRLHLSDNVEYDAQHKMLEGPVVTAAFLEESDFPSIFSRWMVVSLNQNRSGFPKLP
jgi:hypothetical protein